MNRDELLASLGQVSSATDLDLGEGRYIDWSSRNDDGTVTFEVGAMASSETCSHDMTYAEMVELHKRLTLWLLEN